MTDTALVPSPAAGESNAVVVPVATENALVAYSSITGTDVDSKLAVLDATTNAEPIAQHLGEIIRVRDLIILNTTVTDKATGEVSEAQRTVLIAEDGTAYAAMSGGIIRGLTNMIAVMGEPSGWQDPVEVVIVEEGQKGRMYYTPKFGKSVDKYRKAAPTK